MVFGVRLRIERICLIYRQISLKSCLSIVECRLGKYQGMPWSVDAPVLPYVRLYLSARRAESAKKQPHAKLDRAALRLKKKAKCGTREILTWLVQFGSA